MVEGVPSEGSDRIQRKMRVAMFRHGETIESGLINPFTQLSPKGNDTMDRAARDLIVYLQREGVESATIAPFCSTLLRAQQSLSEFMQELGVLAKVRRLLPPSPKLELLKKRDSNELTPPPGRLLIPWIRNGYPPNLALNKWFTASQKEHHWVGSLEPEKVASPILALIANLYKDFDPFTPGPDLVPVFMTHDTSHVSVLKALNPEIKEAPRIRYGQSLIIEIGNPHEGIDYLFNRVKFHLDPKGIIKV